MAAGCVFAKVICAMGITAAVIFLLICITGFLVLIYGVSHFAEWEEKW